MIFKYCVIESDISAVDVDDVAFAIFEVVLRFVNNGPISTLSPHKWLAVMIFSHRKERKMEITKSDLHHSKIVFVKEF